MAHPFASPSASAAAARSASAADREPSAAQLVGLLADRDRRTVFAAVVLGAQAVDDIRRMTALSLRETVTALGRLVDGGLVEQSDAGTLRLMESTFTAAARSAAPARDDQHADQPADVARVLRAHVKDGRLTSIPSSHTKRLVVFDLIVQDFDVDTHYTEPEVNAILVRWHPDTAALRRWLVDVGYLDRDHGDYWRCGGPVAPESSTGGDSSTSR